MTDKPIPGFTAAMRAACAKVAGHAAWKCEDQPDIDDAYKWQTQECVDAVLAMPVAPPHPMPTRDDIAKAICCGAVCAFDSGDSLVCSMDGCEDEATAVLALFGKGGA